MHIVVAPLDKKVENLKIFILVFCIFTFFFFDKNKYSDIPLTRCFPTISTFLSLVKILKGSKGLQNVYNENLKIVIKLEAYLIVILNWNNQ